MGTKIKDNGIDMDSAVPVNATPPLRLEQNKQKWFR